MVIQVLIIYTRMRELFVTPECKGVRWANSQWSYEPYQ